LLTQLDHLPEGLLEATARGLHRVVSNATLIHLPGRRAHPLFVSVLLHGNEDTGLTALQALLRAYAKRELPRALSVFVGNVDAARDGIRRLDSQPDYNRIWAGAAGAVLPEHAMAKAVLAEMRRRRVFAAIDIHNTSGLNPLYACVNRLDRPFLHLARLFSRTVVYFRRPRGVLTAAFARHCPAVAIECGKPGSANVETPVADFIDAALQLRVFPGRSLAPQEIDIYRTVARVTVPPETAFVPGPSGAATLCLPEGVDHLNFRAQPAGTTLARAPGTRTLPLYVHDNRGRAVTGRFLELRGDMVVTRRPVIPAMLTLDERIIRQDCLCYFMRRMRHPEP